MNTYDLGDRPRVGTYSATGCNGSLTLTPTPFRDAITDEPLDPSSVFLSIRRPDGTVETHEYGEPGSIIVRTGVGLYVADIDADEVGRWYYRMWSTGTGQAAEEKDFRVKEANAT